MKLRLWSFIVASLCIAFLAGCGSSMNPIAQNNTQNTQAAAKPPAIISTTQQANPNHRVFVAFSHNMDASTITSDNLSIAGVASTVSYDAKNKIAYLAPNSQLSAGAVYSANVSKNVRDTSGINLAAQYSFAIFTAPV